VRRLCFSDALRSFGLAVVFVFLGASDGIFYHLLGAGWMIGGILNLERYDKVHPKSDIDSE